MKKVNKLLPCPFCGGEAELHYDYHNLALIQCSKCGIGTLHKISEKDVVKTWNTRKPMQEQSQKFTIEYMLEAKMREILERLEEVKNRLRKNDFLMESDVMLKAIEIVKEVGGVIW